MSELNEKTLLTLIEKMGEQNKEAIAAAVSAAVQEANKPKPPTEKELAEIKMAQEHRAETGQAEKQRRANKRYAQQNVCTHEHSKRDLGATYCVWVRDNDHLNDPGYIYCQECEGRFRPESEKWRKLDPNAIFNTALFNKLFQDCSGAQGEIIR